MTRVLLLALDIDLTRPRGDAVHVQHLARSLARLGHAVRLVVARTPRDPIEGVRISERPAAPDPRIVGEIVRIARDHHADILYERRLSPKIAYAAAQILRVPFIVELNGIGEEEAAMQGRSLDEGVVGRAKASLRHWMLRQADSVIAVTPGLRDAAIVRYGLEPSKVFVVPNGVDTDLFRPRDREEARQALSTGSGAIATFVGNLVRWQGLEGLVDAMSHAPPEVRLVLVGEGPDRARIAERARRIGIASRIEWIGEVPHRLVPSYLAAANVCVAPFTRERNAAHGVSALKVYEYLASGRPVVVTDVPGAHELVREFGAGRVVPTDDPVAFGRAIGDVLADPGSEVGAARASLEVRERYSWEATARGVESVLARSLVHAA